MPRPSLGARLYLRQDRLHPRTGKPLPDVWVIRDGGTEASTGLGQGSDPVDREAALTDYLVAKRAKAAAVRRPGDRRQRDPDDVPLADVLAYYAAGRVPTLHGDPATIKGFLAAIEDWWGDKTCGEVVRSNCEAYVAHRCAQPNANYTKDPENAPRISAVTAARELDELSAALSYWDGEHRFTRLPAVWTPEPEESPRDALTRGQAAGLLLAALGWQLKARAGSDAPSWARGEPSIIVQRRHLRRLLLMGFYTGTRHTVMLSLLWVESARQAWVDLDAGVIYRRGRAERDKKTKKRPVVKIPPRLLAHMRRWRAADLRLEANIREARRAAGNPAWAEFRLVSVLHFRGKPLAGKIRTGFAGLVRDAALPAEITPHWMRHTAATWLMQRGVDLWKAAGYLGMTSTTLEAHYGHHHPDYQSDAAGGITRKA